MAQAQGSVSGKCVYRTDATRPLPPGRTHEHPKAGIVQLSQRGDGAIEDTLAPLLVDVLGAAKQHSAREGH